MKKLFTLVALAFMAITANAQTVVSEIDWTTRSEYLDLWKSDGCTVTVTEGEGLIIESTPAEGANYWEPQIPMIGHIPAITEGGQYQVKFTLVAPADGEIRLDFCSWDGTGATSAYVINVTAGESEYVVDFPDYPTECTDAMIFYQCGKMPGTHVIKNVEVIDLEGEEVEEPAEGPAIVSEIDWTTRSEYLDLWKSDGCTVTVTEGEGLIIESTPAEGANYWEPQIPMIGHIPAITEGGQYQVKFTLVAPADGEIRLDFCSWDGTGATSAYVINVTAGESEYVVDFPDYPTECTDAMIFYQCGKMPGTHVIKNVQVIDLEGTAIQSVKKAAKADGAIYNLAGQKVNASYKGIVIKDGKKFIQK